MSPAPEGSTLEFAPAHREVLEQLYARAPRGIRLGLEAMKRACARAGHPERAYRVVHVAGTNGKGSTSAMVEAIARRAGLRTGLYTSPHLCRFAERIRIDGAPLDDATLGGVLSFALRTEPDLSFFETATLAAFLAFLEARVDLAVVEVGIGGRLDATNVVEAPACTAITRVALDHTDRLGDTLAAIAREKAGIVKPGCPLVVGAMDEEARRVIEQAARAAPAPVIAASAPADLEVGAFGAYQRQNAATAFTIAAELGIEETARRRGLHEARWPGRFERVDVAAGALAGPWLLDGAHNPDGVGALADALRAADVAPAAIVCGVLADKAWEPMIDALASIPAAARVFVAPRGRAAVAPERLAARTRAQDGHVAVEAAGTLEDALRRGRRHAEHGLVLVCGSLYLVGDTRAELLGLVRDPAVAL